MNLTNVHPISDRPNTTVPSPTAGTVLGGDVAWGAQTGRSSVWQSACFGSRRPVVQVHPSRPL